MDFFIYKGIEIDEIENFSKITFSNNNNQLMVSLLNFHMDHFINIYSEKNYIDSIVYD
mgnify:CR=1 FL=1